MAQRKSALNDAKIDVINHKIEKKLFRFQCTVIKVGKIRKAKAHTDSLNADYLPFVFLLAQP